MTTTHAPALGRTVTTFEGFDRIPAAPALYEVAYTSDEVTAVCPVTGQPDQYTVEIVVAPRTSLLESKSLKLYFQSFRNMGIFCEAFADRIAADVFAALSPDSVRVRVTQKPRGGIAICATAIRMQEDAPCAP